MRKLTSIEIEERNRRIGAKLGRRGAHPLVVVVENVRSAFNVGAILRTADALRVRHVFLTGFTPDGNHRGVHKSALGAQDTVPWSHRPDTVAVLAELRREGYAVAAVEITDAPTPLDAVSSGHFPIALVLGNEVQGIAPDTLAACDFALEVPQYGEKHSLNVAVAFGVVGYAVLARVPPAF